MADWKLRILDTILTDEATVLSFQFVRSGGPIKEPAIETGLTEEELHQRERALCLQIVERASENLSQLAALKTAQIKSVDSRMTAKAAAAGADPSSGAAAEA